MPEIVQFIHQGSEHGPDKLKNYKSWNTGSHKRKFIETKGDYLENGIVKNNSLYFWGEWEPQSYVKPLDQNGNQLNPKWLHEPYQTKSISNQKGLQNTDPFIFENEFKYLICHQMKTKPKVSSTYLTRLEKGSMILFGSAKYPKSNNAYFQIDTIFVVSDWVDYNPLTNPLIPPYISQTYNEIVYKKAFPRSNPNINLRLYKGATIDNPSYGMHSFVPSKPSITNNIGFSRLVIDQNPYITNNLSQGFKISKNLSPNQVFDFWMQIVNASKRSGFVEGIRFSI